MEKKNLIPSSVPSFAACDEPFPSVSCRCLPQPCVDPRAAPRIMGPGRTRGRCRCLGWWETNQHAGGSAFLALAAPGSPRFELGECSRCSWPAGLRWGISFISRAKNCPPERASTVRRVRPLLEGKKRTPLSCRFATGISWSPLRGVNGVK